MGRAGLENRPENMAGTRNVMERILCREYEIE